MSNHLRFFGTVLWLAASPLFLHGATNGFPAFKHPVMTWVPPYAVARAQGRLGESFGGTGMKDALTHLGLQFWTPTREGGLARAGRSNEVNDAVIGALRDWGRT